MNNECGMHRCRVRIKHQIIKNRSRVFTDRKRTFVSEQETGTAVGAGLDSISACDQCTDFGVDPRTIGAHDHCVAFNGFNAADRGGNGSGVLNGHRIDAGQSADHICADMGTGFGCQCGRRGRIKIAFNDESGAVGKFDQQVTIKTRIDRFRQQSTAQNDDRATCRQTYDLRRTCRCRKSSCFDIVACCHRQQSRGMTSI